MKVKRSAVAFVKEGNKSRRSSKNERLELIAEGVYARIDRKTKFYELDATGNIISIKGDLPDIGSYG